jgi:hypothetical protein
LSTEGTAQPLRVALRFRQDVPPERLTDAEVEVLRCHLAELLREVLRLEQLTEPAE